MRLYLRAISYFRKDLAWIGVLLALILLSVGVGLLQAWPMAILIDSVFGQNRPDDFFHRVFLAPLPKNPLGQVIGVTLIGMGLKISQDTITLLRVMLNNRIKYAGTARVRRELFNHLQALGVAYHKTQPQGDAIYRLTTDTLGCFGVLDTFIATSVAAVTLIEMAAIMLSRSVPLTVYALSIAPLLIGANWWFGKTIRRTSLESKRIDSIFTTAVQRAMASVSLVQMFGRQSHEAGRFGKAVDDSVRAAMKMNWQEQLYPLVVNIIFALGGAVIFGYGGYLVYLQQFKHVPTGVTLGTLTVFMGYLGQLWDPLGRLAGFTAAIQGNAAASERVFQVLDRKPPVADAPDAIDLPIRSRVLTIDQLTFGYSNDRPVLRAVSARILPGQMVAFVGPSGTGKSTLLNLLTRFYDPTDGALRLDGIDARQIKVADLRRHIALVSQDNLLLAASVAENLAYGRPDATAVQIREAAELAGAAEFIEALPEGYETVLSEGAQNLSGGQRQRLAIARALLTEAPILVLDEPTSALDSQHEAVIASTLHRLKRRRTIILVTHRLDSVLHCDQIFVLNEGRIVERGTHAQLIARNGLYAQMRDPVPQRRALPQAA